MAASIMRHGAYALFLCLMASATATVNAGGGGGGVSGPSPQCLNDKPDKVCLSVTASPVPVMPNGRITMTASMSSVLRSTSSRNATLNITFVPTVTVAITSTTAEMNCSASTSTKISCTTDKLGFTETDPRGVTFDVTAPPSGTVTSSAVFGWKGNTGTVVTSVPTTGSSATSTSTQIPAAGGYGQVNYNVSAGQPVGARVDIDPEPGRPNFVLTVSIIDNGPDVDADGSCVAGLASLSPLFFCVDTAPSGNPKRWIKVDLGTAETVIPFHVTRRSDDSIVSGLQLTPDLPFPVGVFVTTFDGTSYPQATGVTTRCSSSPTPPCIELVQDMGGSWTAMVRLMPPATLAANATPFDHLLALLDFVVEPITATGLKPPSLVK